MLIKNAGADKIGVSNPVLADCPPMKGAETMLRQSDKLPPSIAAYHATTNYRATATALLIKRQF